LSSKNTKLEDSIPDIIGTSQSIIALIEGYRIIDDQILKDMAISASEGLIENFFVEKGELSFFRYSLSKKSKDIIIYNASAQALEALSYIFSEKFYKNDMKIICNQVTQHLINSQRSDGSWVYSTDIEGKNKDIQLDFHQGYILDGLIKFNQFSIYPSEILSSVRHGAEYYRNYLFRDDGRSFFRYPIPYPIDIHNQAQGIITFTKLGIINLDYYAFAKRIAMWTIENMQDQAGFFYYQKWPLLKNRIPYIRWGQAWMMLALSSIIQFQGDVFNGEFNKKGL